MNNVTRKFLNIIFILSIISSTSFAQQILPMGKGAGINGDVHTVKADTFHHRLFVSGNYQAATGIATRDIAYKDSSGWHSMGSGISGTASAIEVTATDVYAGGYFAVIDHPEITNIARWDGTTWYSLGGGISGGSIKRIASFQNKLFVIGSFTKAGDSTVSGAAVWDGSNWFPFSNNSSSSKVDLFVHDTSLYLLTQSTATLPYYNCGLFRYNGFNFDSVAGTVIYNGYSRKTFIHDTLFFTTSKALYSYDWTSWHTKYLASSTISLKDLFGINDSLYLITNSGGQSICYFHDSTLSSPLVKFFSYDPDNYSTDIWSSDVLDNHAYIGGNFAYVNNLHCLSLCEFNGSSPSCGGWFTTGYYDPWQNADVISSYFDSATNNLYIAGAFNWAGDSMSFGIARWDGSTWHPMGNGLDGIVYAVIKYNGEIYAGGNFVTSISDTVHYIAKWDGTKWNEIAGGANALVRCLEVHNNQLIAAGWFTSIGGSSISYIAQYDGTSWSALSGNALTGAVHALKEINGTLYAGGYDVMYSSSSTAKYTTSWTSMGSSQNITGFALFNDTVYMSTAEPQIYKRKAVWASLGYSSYWGEGYSQVFDLDGNLCAASTNDGMYRYKDAAWEYVLPPDAYSCTKMNDSVYFLGGFFPYFYTLNGYLYLNNVALFISSNPTATIEINDTLICKHKYVFYEPATNDLLLHYQWHFPGGFPDTSTQYKPVVLYDTIGTYSAYAVVSNWNGVDTIYLQNSIHVSDCGPPVYYSYDNVWMLGYQYSQYDPKPGVDFYYGSPDTLGYYSPMEFHGFSTSICDTNGVLQLYSNGEQLENRYNQTIDSSKNFNDDEFFEDNFYQYSPFQQCMLILPYPDHANQYYIIHESPRYSNGYSILAPVQLWYSIVDMNLNNGLGKMIVKQQPIFYDTLTFSTLQAERHANGRDWWIIIHKYNSDRFYLMLLTPSGISQTNSFSTGPVVRTAGNGQSVFSPDGKTFALCANDSSVIHIFHFDRCVGALSYSHSIKFDYNDSGGSAWGCAFSPNNRYLYVSTFLNLYQIDTACWLNGSCSQLIAEYDGYGDPIPTEFFRMRLGPDNKIYMTPWNGTMHFHVINDPDSASTTCNFVQHQLKLTSYNSITIPEFPNFRAGKLEGSICDTIPDTAIATIIITEKSLEFEVKISPNPTSDLLTIIIFNELENAENSVRIFSSHFQKIYERKLTKNSLSTFVNVDVSHWSKGIYFCEVLSGREILWKKVIVQ